jgi:hypothetical protein
MTPPKEHWVQIEEEVSWAPEAVWVLWRRGKSLVPAVKSDHNSLFVQPIA